MSTDTLLLAVSTFFAMVAALSGVIAVIIGAKSLSEARATITELQQLTQAAVIETKAQAAVAERMEAVVNGSTATVQMLHVTILEAGVQAEIDSLVRVAAAVSEVASACLRIAGGQPEFLFTVAQENLRAALISMPTCRTAAPSLAAGKLPQVQPATWTELGPRCVMPWMQRELAARRSSTTRACSLRT